MLTSKSTLNTVIWSKGNALSLEREIMLLNTQAHQTTTASLSVEA